MKLCVKCGVEANWSSADCPICFGHLKEKTIMSESLILGADGQPYKHEEQTEKTTKNQVVLPKEMEKLLTALQRKNVGFSLTIIHKGTAFTRTNILKAHKAVVVETVSRAFDALEN